MVNKKNNRRLANAYNRKRSSIKGGKYKYKSLSKRVSKGGSRCNTKKISKHKTKIKSNRRKIISGGLKNIKTSNKQPENEGKPIKFDFKKLQKKFEFLSKLNLESERKELNNIETRYKQLQYNNELDYLIKNLYDSLNNINVNKNKNNAPNIYNKYNIKKKYVTKEIEKREEAAVDQLESDIEKARNLISTAEKGNEINKNKINKFKNSINQISDSSLKNAQKIINNIRKQLRFVNFKTGPGRMGQPYPKFSNQNEGPIPIY